MIQFYHIVRLSTSCEIWLYSRKWNKLSFILYDLLCVVFCVMKKKIVFFDNAETLHSGIHDDDDLILMFVKVNSVCWMWPFTRTLLIYFIIFQSHRTKPRAGGFPFSSTYFSILHSFCCFGDWSSNKILRINFVLLLYCQLLKIPTNDLLRANLDNAQVSKS